MIWPLIMGLMKDKTRADETDTCGDSLHGTTEGIGGIEINPCLKRQHHEQSRSHADRGFIYQVETDELIGVPEASDVGSVR